MFHSTNGWYATVTIQMFPVALAYPIYDIGFTRQQDTHSFVHDTLYNDHHKYIAI